MTVSFFLENYPSIRCSSKSHKIFSIAFFNNRREGSIIAIVLVNNKIFDLGGWFSRSGAVRRVASIHCKTV